MLGNITNRQTNLSKKQTTQEDDAVSINAVSILSTIAYGQLLCYS